MKILGVKFYQGIRLAGEVLTHVENNLAEYGTGKTGATGVTVQEVPNGVLLTKGEHATLATWNNVQYVQYSNKPTQETKKSK
jgi:hypothetical protein